MHALTNATVLTPDGLKEAHTVLIEAGRVVDVIADGTVAVECTEVLNLDSQLLVPGFIDLQVNGGGGVLFNDAPNIETLRIIAAAHRRFGTTGMLPTLISDDLETVASAIEAVDAAIAAGVPGILGIHLEGPFLNPTRRGVHDVSKFRTPGDEEIELLCSLQSGKALVTIAPEIVNPRHIRRLVESGVIVAAGHSDATSEQVDAALAAGLCGFTHLYNAMSPLASRAPGMVGSALINDGCWCGVIVDGHHVHPTCVKIALQCKPAGKLLLVTDAMSAVGTKAEQFMLGDEQISIRNGRCETVNGTLAGSNLDMARAVRNAQKLPGLDLAEAIRMASLYPAKALGLDDVGTIERGARADLVLLDDDGIVLKSWIGGQS